MFIYYFKFSIGLRPFLIKYGWRMEILPPSSLNIPFFFSFLLPFSHLPQILSPVSPMRASCLCSSTGHLLFMYLLLAAVYYRYEGLNTQLWSQTVCVGISAISLTV